MTTAYRPTVNLTYAERRDARRFARDQHANDLANHLLNEYGGDKEAASERLLSYCNGQHWLARLVTQKFYPRPRFQRRGRPR
jgi:hypothetical protein